MSRQILYLSPLGEIWFGCRVLLHSQQVQNQHNHNKIIHTTMCKKKRLILCCAKLLFMFMLTERWTNECLYKLVLQNGAVYILPECISWYSLCKTWGLSVKMLFTWMITAWLKSSWGLGIGWPIIFPAILTRLRICGFYLTLNSWPARDAVP